MNNKSILIIAPGHNENDARVNRTIAVLSRLFLRVDVVYESRFIFDKEAVQIAKVNTHYVDGTKPLWKIIPKMTVFKNYLIKNNLVSDCVYIHDGGVLGLLIARMLRGFFPTNSKIIFDYHDLIEWEVHFQLNKFFSLRSLNRYVGKLLLFLFFLKLKTKNERVINGIIGISTSQLNRLSDCLEYNRLVPTAVIPNTRKKLSYEFGSLTYVNRLADFLWVGNIVEGRDLLVSIDFLDYLNKSFDFNFYVFGRVHSSRVFGMLEERPYFKYMGEFSSDCELLEFVRQKKIISIFFGWDDKFNVGINEVASPNKIYSYLNIGTPMLLHKKVNPIDFKPIHQVGCVFQCKKEFEKAYLDISERYEHYRKSIYDLRDLFLWDEDLLGILSTFASYVYFDGFATAKVGAFDLVQHDDHF